MNLYLLDENIIAEMRPGGDATVAAWLKTVDDAQLRLSAMTFFEKRRGWERQLRKGADADAVAAKLAAVDALNAAYGDRVIAMGALEMAEWARLLGAKDKNQRDTALAATARVHGLVVVTRNVADFIGRDVRVLNPFKAPPTIVRV